MSAPDQASVLAPGVSRAGEFFSLPPPRRLLAFVGLALTLAYAIVLVGANLDGQFLADRQGAPIANDFVNVYAAGRLTLQGAPAAAYDWPKHKQAEVEAVGHDFADYYGWHYPPPFLFVAAGLAALPYFVAAIGWLAASFAAYAAAIIGILDRRLGLALACGFPAALWNITAGQNGFFTAALIGGTLGLLERHPALAGICLGLLTYKPQFGLLFPLALVADRRWLTIGVAAAVAIGLGAMSWLLFGSLSWEAFFHWMPITSRAVLTDGQADWSRLQSLFGFIRAQGGSERLAWTTQVAGSIAVAASMLWLWQSRAPFDLKAAALVAATLVATPYIYMYDVVVLAVAAAFLLRFALERRFGATDALGLIAAGALILIYPYVKTQVGLAAALIVLGVALRHASARAPIIPPAP